MTTPDVQDVQSIPKTFDLDAFLGNFKPANWKVRVPTRGDLLVEIEQIRADLEALKAESDESAVGDGRSKTKLIEQHNKLVAEFEAANVEFTFRPSEISDHIAARAAAKENGLDLDSDYAEQRLYPYLWAATCIEPAGVTAEAFIALRRRVGDVAMGILHRTWLKANNGGELVDAPFSPKSLPTPTTEKRSKK